jgi:uncharacterized membrane protein YccC
MRTMFLILGGTAFGNAAAGLFVRGFGLPDTASARLVGLAIGVGLAILVWLQSRRNSGRG